MTRTGRPSSKRVEKALLDLLVQRGTATVSPSEVARALDRQDWQALLDRVRAAAVRLQQRGKIDVYQHGRPIDLEHAKGPVRFRDANVKDIDYRREPFRYRVGRGEEGVLTVQPYKGELLPLWRFASPEQAKISAMALWKKFLEYGRASDFVGMDMARKYLQMGFTRSRRYANHVGGRKYAAGTRTELPRTLDAQKAAAAEIFRTYWQRAQKNANYRRLRSNHEKGIPPDRASAPYRSRLRA